MIISTIKLPSAVKDVGDLVEMDFASIELRALAAGLDLIWASPECKHQAPRPMKQAKAHVVEPEERLLLTWPHP